MQNTFDETDIEAFSDLEKEGIVQRFEYTESRKPKAESRKPKAESLKPASTL